MTSEDALKPWLERTDDEVFERFAGRRSARTERGTGDQRFLYLPGTRSHRVLLVAHADTVWDGQEGFPQQVVCENGLLRGADPRLGCGADDRAGCALLWELRDLGHSLLILNGEEKEHVASRFLMTENAGLAQEINATHQFAVQFDRRNGTDFKCYDVGTDEFRAYCAMVTGYTEPDRVASTDIRVLCRTICGVNLSTGFHKEHTREEYMDLAEWAHTLTVSRGWLSASDLPRFPLVATGTMT